MQILNRTPMIFAIIVPIALYMFQIQDKKLTYEIYSYYLINFSSSIKDEVEINFSGKKVTDLSAINIEMKNAGDIPIRKEDFERNITIDFGKEARVLKMTLKYKSPSNLMPVINNTEDSIQISPLLLNSGDKFSIEAIVSKPAPDPIFDARIAGIKAPIKNNRELYSGRLLADRLIVFLVCMFMTIYGFLSAFAFVAFRPSIRKQQIILYQPLMTSSKVADSQKAIFPGVIKPFTNMKKSIVGQIRRSFFSHGQKSADHTTFDEVITVGCFSYFVSVMWLLPFG